MTVTGLNACTEYAVRVAALTNIGVGPYSEAYNVSTLGGAGRFESPVLSFQLKGFLVMSKPNNFLLIHF